MAFYSFLVTARYGLFAQIPISWYLADMYKAVSLQQLSDKPKWAVRTRQKVSNKQGKSMKRILTFMVVLLMAVGMTAQDKVIRKQNNGTYVVNTKTIARDVRGYSGPTPLEIHIKNNRIVKVLALTNYETRNYFERVKKLLFPKWVGMTVKEASKAEVDAVTGATVSSKAVNENIKRGLKYYTKNK